MNRQITTICIFLCVAFFAQAQNWTQLGGTERFPRAMYQDGNSIFVATNNDILRSDNGGNSWTSNYGLPKQSDINPGPYDYFHYLGQRAVFRETGTMIIESRQSYIGDQQTMIFSNDRGQSHAVQVGQASVSQKGGQRFFGFYEKDPSTFVVSISGSVDYYGSYMSHQYSTDGGETWESLNLHQFSQTNSGRWDEIVGWIGDQLYTVTAANAFNTNAELYVRNFPDTTLLNSILLPDAGENKLTNISFVENGLVYHIYLLASGELKVATYQPTTMAWSSQNFNISLANPGGIPQIYKKGNQLFLVENGSYNSNIKPVVWRKNLSDNVLFSQVNLDLPSWSSSLAIYGTGNNLFLSTSNHVFQSTDGGVSWTDFLPIGNGNSPGGNLQFFDDEIWVSSGQTLFKKDADLIWDAIRPDFTGIFNGYEIRGFQKLNGSYYLALRGGGLYRWNGTEGGALTQVFAPPTATYNAIIFPTLSQSDGRLFFGTQDADRNRLVYVSDDGSNWTPFSGSNFFKSGNRIFSERTGGTFYSDDNGQNWTLSTAKSGISLKKEELSGDLYFLFGDFSSGKYQLHRSSNNGTSWQIITYDPPSGETLDPFGYWVSSARLLLRGDEMIAKFRTKVYKRKVTGADWEELDFPFRTANNFYPRPTEGLVYFTSISEGVWSIGIDELFDNSPPPPGDEKGLSLSAVGNPENPGAWTNATATFTLKNNENYAFSNIQIEFVADDDLAVKGGDEYDASAGTVQDFWTQMPTWSLASLAAGETATIELNYFTKSTNSLPVYGQIAAATGTDPNSTPGNGTCCTPNEDDEAVVNFNGAGPPPPTGDPDLSITGFSTIPEGVPGEVTTYTFDLNNTGGRLAAGDYEVGAYLSEFSTLNANSVRVGWVNTGNTPIGTIRNVPGAITIPAGIAPGFYYLILWADDGEEITELDENNNQVALPFQVIEVAGGQPDLTIVNAQPEPPVLNPGESLRLRNTFVNLGNVSAPRSTAKIYWSIDDQLSPDDQFRGTQTVFNLAPNTDQERTTSVYTDADMAPGIYYIIVEVDADNEVAESNENNNVLASIPVEVGLSSDEPDLRVRSVNFQNPSAANQPFSFGYNIENDGNNSSGAFTVWAVLSEDQTPSLDDQNLMAGGTLISWNSLPGNASRQGTVFGTFPNVPAGDYYLIFQVDVGDSVNESDETNNLSVSPIRVTNLGTIPDLSLELLSAPTSGFRGMNYPVEFNLLNSGDDIAQSFFAAVHISTDNVFDPSEDLRIGTNSYSSGMSGNILNDDISIGIGHAPGNYTMFLWADSNERIPESDETNNIVSFPFEIKSPNSGSIDLELEFGATTPANPPQWGFYSETLIIRNTGTQTATGVEVEFKASPGATYKGGDEYSATQGNFRYWSSEIWTVGSLAAGSSATITVNYFLVNPNAPVAYAQVEKANQTDDDSTPGNGTCCTANEDDEANTGASQPMLPDLELANLQVLNAPMNLQDLQIEFDLINSGNETAFDEFYTSAFISSDDIISPDDKEILLSRAGNFLANSTIKSDPYFRLDNTLPGNYFFIIKIDSYDEIVESDENNNEISVPFQVLDSPGAPDLTANRLTINTGPGFPTDEISYNFFVENAGATQSGVNSVSFKTWLSTSTASAGDEYFLNEGTIPYPPPAGNVSSSSTIPTSIPPGQYFLILEIDSDNQITESDELNNQTVFSDLITVGGSSTGVDLELSFEPLANSNPAQWSFFGTTMTLKNNGTEPATDVQVLFKKADEVVYKGNDEFTSSQGQFEYYGNEIWSVGTLNAGEIATLDVNYFRLSANAFTAFAQVISLDQNDSDSSPNNGSCCVSNEDDEAILDINGSSLRTVGNRNLLAENISKKEAFAILNATPNPILERFDLEVFSTQNQQSEVLILDVLGRPVLRQAVELSEGHNSIPIDASDLPSGILTVKMSPEHRYLRQIRVLKVE